MGLCRTGDDTAATWSQHAAAVRTAAAIVPLGGGTYCRGMLRPSCTADSGVRCASVVSAIGLPCYPYAIHYSPIRYQTK